MCLFGVHMHCVNKMAIKRGGVFIPFYKWKNINTHLSYKTVRLHPTLSTACTLNRCAVLVSNNCKNCGTTGAVLLMNNSSQGNRGTFCGTVTTMSRKMSCKKMVYARLSAYACRWHHNNTHSELVL